MDSQDSGLMCLFYCLQFFNISYNPQNIIHQYSNDKHFDNEKIVLALRSSNLKAQLKKINKEKIKDIHFPAIARKHDGEFIFIVKYNKAEDKYLYQPTQSPEPVVISREELLTLIDCNIILVTKKYSLVEPDFKFGIGWFITAFSKYKKPLTEVLIASFFIQILSLLSPIFFQVTIDKVLVHNSLTTLDVLVIGLFFVSIFEVGLSLLRTYLLNHTTNKVDVALGSSLFSHLMNLPLTYFSSRKVGQIVARVCELDTIRAFITSSALTLCIDLLFTIIFFGVMWFYSKILTFIVLGSIPFYILIAFVLTPLLQKKLNQKFAQGAENQAFLVESINGAETIKSLALEPKMKQHWNGQLADYVLSSFKVNIIGNLYSQSTNLISKLVMILTLYYGAQFVLNGDMTIGMLISFNMLANRVSNPILKIAQLWNDFQQANISIKRLSDILNTKQELGSDRSKLSLNNISGNIHFNNVNFKYKADGRNILNTVDLKINAGEVIGIVGRSGSGKSTLAKLLQRLYIPSSGKLTIDGFDLSTVDPAWLRRQIGVVLQDNFLFSRSIKDNIAISDPSISVERVIEAAKLAGAHEFISEMPEGYDTLLEEHGSNLSGGQKQRIAIARALINEPKILIFDEATSALDYESEAIIQKNMKDICKGKTVLIIAHRLTAVRNANKIIVMENGSIIEEGKHEELLKIENGFYKKLNTLQERGEI